MIHNHSVPRMRVHTFVRLSLSSPSLSLSLFLLSHSLSLSLSLSLALFALYSLKLSTLYTHSLLSLLSSSRSHRLHKRLSSISSVHPRLSLSLYRAIHYNKYSFIFIKNSTSAVRNINKWKITLFSQSCIGFKSDFVLQNIMTPCPCWAYNNSHSMWINEF